MPIARDGQNVMACRWSRTLSCGPRCRRAPSICASLPAALAAQALGHFAGYHAAMFDAFWAHPRSVATRESCEALLDLQGVPGKDVFALAEQPEMDEALNAANAAAVDAGVFGVPFFRVEQEIFFGADRLDFVRNHALEAAS
ncbi:MAG: DsbA family protein [Proteobacteria bacterium]|nr:DsbA family protein [Pseudomonadota bacterium]